MLDDDLIIIHPAVEIPGVDTAMDPAEIAGVDPDFDDEPTGVDMGTDAWAIDTDDPVDSTAIAIDGLKQKILLRAQLRCPVLSQLQAQIRQRAQPRRLHPLRGDSSTKLLCKEST